MAQVEIICHDGTPASPSIGCDGFLGSAFIFSEDFVLGNTNEFDPSQPLPSGSVVAISQNEGIYVCGFHSRTSIGTYSYWPASDGVTLIDSEPGNTLATMYAKRDLADPLGFPPPCTLNQGVSAKFMGEVDGNPISGVALAIDPTSTAEDATLLCLVYDTTTDPPEMKLMKYVDQSLNTYGTIIDSFPFTLNINDNIGISIYGPTGELAGVGPTIHNVYIQAGAENRTYNGIIDDAFMVAGLDHGIVAIGTHSGHGCDAALWGLIDGVCACPHT